MAVLFALVTAVQVGAGLLIRTVGVVPSGRLARLGLAFAIEAPAAIAALALARRWRWVRRIGFRRPEGWSALPLAWLPLAYLGLTAAGVASHVVVHGAGRLLGLAAFTLLIGISEETWFRGLVLEALLPGGAVRAVLVSSALFGVAHTVNLLAGQSGSGTARQVLFAFCLGVAYAGLRLRVRSIIPGIVLHATQDFLVLLRGSAVVAASAAAHVRIGALVTAFGPLVLYGLVLASSADARHRQARPPSLPQTIL